MTKDLALKLRFLGVIPRAGYLEYGFCIEAEDRGFRIVVLTIDDAFFRGNKLMRQEAPDLCYQKMLVNMDKETTESSVPSRLPVTALDIAHYRDSHPTAKLRKRS